jgi:hypothetical protein
MTQLLLFNRQGKLKDFAPDITARKHHNSPTSIEAHERIRHRKSVTRAEVLRFIVRRGLEGSTVQECSIALKLGYTTVSARCAELKADHLVYATRRRRPTTSGCTAAVLVATEVVCHG